MNSTYRIRECGCWRRDQVGATWATSTWRDLPEVREAIESTWREALHRPDVVLFDGPMCRLESIHRDSNRLHLELSPTSYKIFYGTNLHHAELADRFGEAVLANAVGISVGLISADHRVLLGQRTSSVAYYPDRVHPFAGTLEPRDALDVFASAQRELNEELQLSSEQIDSIELIGLAEDCALRQPELIFRVCTNVTSKQLESQLQHAEHRSIFAIPFSEEDLMMAQAREDLTPIARATLELCSRSAPPHALSF